LLIDIKSEAETTYAAVKSVLKNYADILTVFRDDKSEAGAITAIISGNRNKAMLLADTVRYAAYDGQLEDLESNASPELVPWISSRWNGLFQWKGTGPIAENEREKLRALVELVHKQGRKLRLYAAPDNPLAWAELRSDGVDLINTDDLAGCRDFLLKEGQTGEKSGKSR